MSSAAAAPTESQRRAADALRAEGNILFQKGRFAAAAERYTEAIVLHPSAPLFVNRALCARKQLAAAAAAAANGASGGADAAAAATALWRRVLSDARRALELDRANMKGLYLSGLALRELGGEGDGEGEGGGDGGRAPREAIALLARALEEARAKDDAIKDEIWRELAKANDAAWRAESARRAYEVAALRGQLRALAAAAGADPPPFAAGASSSSGAASSSSTGSSGAGAPRVDWAALERVFSRAAAADARGEVPGAFTCPLTMEVFRDPVTTPCGQTYERAALLEHLERVGAFDPVTRAKTAASDVRPNVAMRAAVAVYLEEHGWAWRECY